MISKLYLSATALLCCQWAYADGTTSGDSSPTALTTVVVTATRHPQSSHDLPVAISRVERASIQRGKLQVNLSESLSEVPGASVQNRQNYAQDLQVSVRGFGARSSFGVRGVRLYADGIPGTMPDGQGQFSQFDLGSADRIEVLRGPFSALYGNSSGGVIAIFTEHPPPGLQWQTSLAAGSFGTRRAALKVSGGQEDRNFLVDVAHFETNGYRDHSAAQRNNFNSRVAIELSGNSRLTLIANLVQTPSVQDPLGLTQAQLSTPEQAGDNAIAYNTRKSLQQEQAGVAYDLHAGAGLDLAAMLYGGHRATTQFQAIPRAAQARPTHPGGVIDLGRTFWGTDLHVSREREVAARPLRLTAGIAFDTMDEARRGYLNFAGSTVGVTGDLRRDLRNRVYDLDEYVQAQWDPAAKWRVLAGLRHSIVDVRSIDQLAAPGVAAETGVRYQATNPVAGLTYRATPGVAIYAAFGRGFETPTLNDIAYRSVDGSVPGLNLDLRPARSNNYELGLKTSGLRAALDLSVFHIDTRDELAVLQNSGGRSVFQNVAATTRRGIELGAHTSFNSSWSGRLAYTWMRAVVAEPYQTCTAVPCLQATTTVAAGSRLPALPQHSFYSALSWQPTKWGLTVTAELIGRAQIYANDTNLAAASGYWLGNLSLGLEQSHSAWHCSEYVRIDNVTARQYVGSVIVNESNGRYFEPEPGRSFYLMFTLLHK